MKKIILALAAFTTLGFAGGNIAPIDAPVAVIPTTNDFYVGGQLTAVQTYVNGQSDWFDDGLDAETGYGFGIQAGYVFYRTGDFSTAIEGRVSKTFWNYGMDGFQVDGSDSLLTYSLLLKPQYNFGDFGVYGLVGYGKSKFESGSFSVQDNDIVWGGGANYAINDTWEIFADYTVNPSFEEDAIEDIENDIIAIGVNYKF